MCYIKVFIYLFFLLCVYAKNYVRGPKSFNDKIAIVGAGVSGIHMAYLLKQKGFKNVQVLEKTSEIGGKSKTIYYRGAAQELGTCYISPDYTDVIKLVKKIAPDELVPFPSASIWLDNVPRPITYQQYLGAFAGKLLGTKSPLIIKKNLVQTIMKYNRLHKQIFGEYEGELMPRPNPESLAMIKGSFLDYVYRNKLQLLIPIFQASTTVQGYGQLNDTAALYGLMWNTPKFLMAFLTRMQGDQSAGMYILRSGFQEFWKNLVDKENIRVKFNVNIRDVYRVNGNEGDTQNILLFKNHGNTKPKWEQFDFLIWSPEMKTSFEYWKNLVKSEKQLFSKTKEHYFTASIVNYFDEIRGLTPIDYWIDHMFNRRKNSVWAQRDTYSVLNGFKGPLYRNKTFPTGEDRSPTKTIVAYQMSEEKPDPNELERGLLKQIKSVGGRGISIMKQKTWRYFPRYSIKDIEDGVLWDIFEMQGKHAMWYIGSSVCFESIKSVFQYNLQLVNNLKPIIDNSKN